MIDDLKPYPEYKDSGLPWLGNAPTHWSLASDERLLFREPLIRVPDNAVSSNATKSVVAK